MSNFNKQDMDGLNQMKSDIALQDLFHLLLKSLPAFQKMMAFGQFEKYKEEIRLIVRKNRPDILKLLEEI